MPINMNEFLCQLEQYKPITDFLIALIPIMLAILGSYIAIQQYRTNRKKLKIELFEKRFKVFDSINKFIGAVVRTQSVDQQQRNDFLAGTRGAEFLFDITIKEYVDKIWETSVDLGVWAEDINTSAHASERAEHMKWFVKQLQEIDGKFKKYMQLSH